MKPKNPSCPQTKGERKVITSRALISACLDKVRPPGMFQMLKPITLVETDVKLARHCIGVRQIKVQTGEDEEQMGREVCWEEENRIWEDKEERMWYSEQWEG